MLGIPSQAVGRADREGLLKLEGALFRRLSDGKSISEMMKKTLKKRNPYHPHPLMRKCSTHGKSKKALRRGAKMSLRQGDLG